jgi:hypothetical protein
MFVDPTRFPLASSYLQSLPNGMESFPECLTRGETLESYFRDFGKFASDAGLPKVVQDMLRTRPEARWVSEVGVQVVNLVVRDLAFQSDDAFDDWTYTASQTIYDKPFVRTLMRLMSPTLIVIGASKRWATFHKGSQLTAGPITESHGRVESTALLQYPVGLFPDLYLRGLTRAFLAALAGSRGKDVRVKLGNVKATSAEYQVSFQA